MVNEGVTNTSYVQFHNSDTDNGKSIERRRTEEVIANDAVEIVSLNSHSVENAEEKQPILALRFLVAFTIWLGLFIVHGGRFFTYIAIASHHIYPYLQELLYHPNSFIKNENITANDGITSNQENSTNEEENISYGYNVQFTGLYSMLAFICGYTVSGIPAGYLAHIYPPTRIFFFGVTMSCLVNVFYPVIISSFGCLVAAHIFQGLAEGMILPACFGAWVYWSEPKERNYIVITSYSGMLFGILAGSEFSRQLMNEWKTGYYMFGLMALLWLILWICVYTIPSLIESEQEQKPINILSMFINGIGKNIKPILWKTIVSSKPVWAIIMATACHRCFFTFIFHPELLHHNSFGINLRNNVTDSSLVWYFANTFYLPFSFSILILLLLILVYWHLTTHRNVPIIRIRKIATCLGLALQIPSFLLMGFLNVPWINIMVFVLPLLGYFINPFDISPKYASIVVGISNTFANIIIIFTVGLIVLHINHVFESVAVLIILVTVLAIFLIATCIFYAIFASAEKQSWAE